MWGLNDDKCIFLRHGETDWNLEGRTQGRTDIPLNRNGELQAKESGVALKDKEIDVIITSPLKELKLLKLFKNYWM